MTHTIVVTEAPGEDRDDPVFTIEGECDFSCEVWWECRKNWHRHPKNPDDYDEWATKRVPEVHQWLDGGWCVRNVKACGAWEAFAQENYDDQLTKVGTYSVVVHWDDWWWLELALVHDDIKSQDSEVES